MTETGRPPGADDRRPPTLPAVFRPRRVWIFLHVVGAALTTAMVVVALALPTGGPGAWGVGDRAALVCFGLFCWGVAALLARPKVVVDEAGLTVVNVVRRRRLEWAEVVRVNLRQGDPWVLLDLSDGTTLAAMGIQPAGGRDQAVRGARALRDLVDAHAPEDPRG
ncbi:PH domain-containing protein [Allostreptomyces psammosilenae]|uniref:Low molecular weight protein antigen 6 PH domain-containing protein n=1 Tax=Allostreptomyces psammosilenae TaxID=1892865 RepID=A0A852ZR73_9ACTN|nr:PH domain-containing protein [Allostreptomyces psammosilenae]NYI04255.1 hypothetical protein [Allostreptomyces psammosilenae]